MENVLTKIEDKSDFKNTKYSELFKIIFLGNL